MVADCGFAFPLGRFGGGRKKKGLQADPQLETLQRNAIGLTLWDSADAIIAETKFCQECVNKTICARRILCYRCPYGFWYLNFERKKMLLAYLLTRTIGHKITFRTREHKSRMIKKCNQVLGYPFESFVKIFSNYCLVEP